MSNSIWQLCFSLSVFSTLSPSSLSLGCCLPRHKSRGRSLISRWLRQASRRIAHVLSWRRRSEPQIGPGPGAPEQSSRQAQRGPPSSPSVQVAPCSHRRSWQGWRIPTATTPLLRLTVSSGRLSVLSVQNVTTTQDVKRITVWSKLC